jgi:Tol biopolymer transport system component
VDQRADIWAFGCVLYELLTGLRAFPGETASDSLASVLARQPDWSVLPAATPTAIRQLLHGCLDKDLAQRVRDISDVRLEIEQAIAAPFSVTDEPTSGVRAPTASRLPWRWATWIPLGLVLITGFLVWRAWRFPQEPLLARPLTSLPGVEAYPSFSPEGRYVTFMWTGPKQDNPDIYVQQIGVGNPIQLTTDVRADYNPVWSPDGRWIAFLRAVQLPPPSSPAPTSELVLIPPFGGAERKLRELHFRIIGAPGFLAWCPDSSCLIATDSVGERQPDALFVVSLESGQTRQLTAPLPLALGDCNPAISPDSTSMVFRRVPASGAGELYRLALGKGPTARGTPERLTPSALDAAYPAWLPDGKGILFSAQRRLWSLAIPGHSRPSLLPFSGEDGMMPAVSRAEPGGPTRLVYVRSSSDTNVWRVETSAAGAVALSAPAVAISSTRADIAGDFSPDGQRVAFASNRSGSFEIWLADPDGSNAAALTSTGASMTAAPAWSPDGRLIAFHSNIEGQFEIYVTSPEDAQLRRVTSDPGNDHVPSFSRDNRWIYFGSTRSANSRAGDYQIWKMPTAGGEAIQVTRSGGFKAVESLDGRYLYYTQAPGNGALWRVPTSGGPEVKLIEEVLASSFAVVDKGIYYPDRTLGQTALRFFGFGTGRSMTVVRGLGDIGSLLTASPDGRTILYTKRDAWVEDLVMVDNFRSPF